MTIERMRDIHAFVHVAEAKSFTAAAERMGMSRSAVGKSVIRLEDRLGVRLLQRTTRSVSLTGEGAVFHERCIRILADLDEAEMSMLSHSQTPRGRLRLELPVSFGRLHVLPIVNEFMSKWPEISVNVSFNDRFVDLIDEGIDLAVRLGGSDDSRLMTRYLAPHRLVTCASPSYLKKYGVPTDVEQLLEHSCLSFVHGGRPAEWRFSGWRASFARSSSMDVSAPPTPKRCAMRRWPATASPSSRPFSSTIICAPAAWCPFSPSLPPTVRRCARSIRQAAIYRQRSAHLSTSSWPLGVPRRRGIGCEAVCRSTIKKRRNKRSTRTARRRRVE